MKKPPKGRTMAGVIPLSGAASVYGMPWPDYLQPINQDYTAIERSVYECAIAGCDSIWIVCNDDVAPLVKERVGDYVLDPAIFERWAFIKNQQDHKKNVPVFFVPIHQKDRDRRDSLGWSVLHGALTAFLVSSRISSWFVPNKYFVSFPQAAYDPMILKGNREIIRGRHNFYLSCGGKTVKDNEYLAFTFSPENWLLYKRAVKNNCSGGSRNLPAHERWSSRHFTLDKIFNHDKIVIDNSLEVESYYNLDSWEGLLEYYRSTTRISRPSKAGIGPHKFKQRLEEKWKKE